MGDTVGESSGKRLTIVVEEREFEAIRECVASWYEALEAEYDLQCEAEHFDNEGDRVRRSEALRKRSKAQRDRLSAAEDLAMLMDDVLRVSPMREAPSMHLAATDTAAEQ